MSDVKNKFLSSQTSRHGANYKNAHNCAYDEDGHDNADAAEVDDAECDALMELTSLASAEVKPKQPHFTAGPEQSANIKQIQIKENTNCTSQIRNHGLLYISGQHFWSSQKSPLLRIMN